MLRLGMVAPLREELAGTLEVESDLSWLRIVGLRLPILKRAV